MQLAVVDQLPDWDAEVDQVEIGNGTAQRRTGRHLCPPQAVAPVDPLRRVWNEDVALRFGAQVAEDGGSGLHTASHRTWTVQGVLRMASLT